jgi:UDP-N-acetylmuramate--alanine ligase
MNRFPAPAEVVPAAELGHIHFVGIGGVGMAPLARAVLGRGLPLSGSEIKDTATVRELRELGATVTIGQAAENLDGVDTVVFSADIPDRNIELVEARARGLRLLHRASALAALMPGYRSVAIAGTHGKTTTTSMVTVALRHLGLDPSFVIGGELGDTGESGHAGSGDILVAEADESDGTFTHYRPDVSVITNIELDHPDHFADVAQVRAEFQDFADRLEPGTGTLVCFADDPAARAIAERTAARGVRVLTYGEGEDVDIRATGIGSAGGFPTFTLVTAADTYGPLTLSIPARHNALNAAAALGVALALGVDVKPFLEGAAGFSGARRRMQFLGEAAGVKVYDTYGHHPTEIASDLSAARELAGAGRVVAAFQPHRYFRTNTFLHEFGPALSGADAVVVLDVYSHGEQPIPGVGGDVIAAETGLPAEASVFEPDFDRVPQRLAGLAAAGDLVVTIGAGDVTEIGPRLLKLLG